MNQFSSVKTEWQAHISVCTRLKVFVGVLIIALLGFCNVSAQTTVTITGAGVATNGPFDIADDNYVGTGDIYQSNEINASGTITALEWDNFSCPVITIPSVKIYMKLVPTSTTTWTTETYSTAITGATLVYSGSYLSNANGFANPITLTTPFAYTTANNLEIITEADYGSEDDNEPSWYYNSTVSNSDCSWYSASQSGLPGASNSTGGIDQYRPAIRITFTATCPAPTITNFTPTSACYGSGATVTVNGTHFVSGSTAVTVNGTAATVAFVDTDQITFALPAGASVYREYYRYYVLIKFYQSC